MSNTCLCYCLNYFAGIMGDFAWRPLVKQVGPTGAIVPPSITASSAEDVGQLVGEVDLVIVVGEVTPNAHSSMLVKRKMNDAVGP